MMHTQRNDTASYDTDDLIAALATPPLESALAVIRTSGNGAAEAVSRCFSAPERLVKAAHGTMVHGYIIDPRRAPAEQVDEVLLGVFRAPGGYTGQDSIEIYCHGSLPGIEQILQVLRHAGFRDAAPGEFTLRAFLSGKMDLTQAEAVREIVAAKSAAAHSMALHRLSGCLHERIDREKQRLLSLQSILEVQLDYAEDEVDEDTEIPLDDLQTAERNLRNLAASYTVGKVYHEGVRIALAGRTNAGKSSLFNLFLREDRSIVSDIHGTTRDYIESWISVRGIPVRLYDTAGLRHDEAVSTEDQIELEGISRSEQIASAADIVIYLFDGTVGITPADKELFAVRGDDPRYIFVMNKSDSMNNELLDSGVVPAGVLKLSALTGAGFQELEEAVVQAATRSGSSHLSDEVIINSQRQKDLLDTAVEALEQTRKAVDTGMPVDIIAQELQTALHALGEITGEVTSEDILDSVFSGFCVGK